MITEVGSGLYAYMVMLENDGRKEEAAMYSKMRDRIFSTRSKVFNDTPKEVLAELANEMRSLHNELVTARTFLAAWKPGEAMILHSVTNTAGHVAYYIEHFGDKEK
jgi:hypothetical protein